MSYRSTKAHNVFSDSLRNEEIDPPDQKHLPGNPVSAATLASGTDEDVYIDMDGYRYLGISASTGSGTDTIAIKVYATADSDPDPTGPTYVDVTNDWFGSASFTGDFAVTTGAIAMKWVKINYVTAGGAGDQALYLHTKQMY